MSNKEQFDLLEIAKEDVQACHYVIENQRSFTDSTTLARTLQSVVESRFNQRQQIRIILIADHLYQSDIRTYGWEALSSSLQLKKGALAEYLLKYANNRMLPAGKSALRDEMILAFTVPANGPQ